MLEWMCTVLAMTDPLTFTIITDNMSIRSTYSFYTPINDCFVCHTFTFCLVVRIMQISACSRGVLISSGYVPSAQAIQVQETASFLVLAYEH